MSKILFTTTPNIEVGKITAYYGIVNTSVVLGVNVISDFVASFSDFFGGHSGEYQGKLDTIFSDIMKNLTEKAQRTSQKINAIVGLSIDFDEISGKGKQMFMATAIGTMCSVEYETPQDDLIPNVPNTISFEELEEFDKTELISSKLNKDYNLLTDEDWQFILSHSLVQIAEAIIEKTEISAGWQEQSYFNSRRKKFIQYVSTLPLETQKDIVYNKLENEQLISSTVNELRLFDATLITALLKKGEAHKAAICLKSNKLTYSLEDLENMKTLAILFENLPIKGKVVKEQTKSIFGKKEGNFFICPNGHKNEAEYIFCPNCGLNIKGLTQDDINNIEAFKHKVELIEKLFRRK